MKRVIAAIAVSVALLGLSLPANAGETERHCVFAFTSARHGHLVGCWSDESSAARAVARGGSIHIGTLWSYPDYSGSSYWFTAPTTCNNANPVYAYPSGWSQWFVFGPTSGQGFGGCDANRYWEQHQYTGRHCTCGPNCYFVDVDGGGGFWAGSVKWRNA